MNKNIPYRPLGLAEAKKRISDAIVLSWIRSHDEVIKPRDCAENTIDYIYNKYITPIEFRIIVSKEIVQDLRYEKENGSDEVLKFSIERISEGVINKSIAEDIVCQLWKVSPHKLDIVLHEDKRKATVFSREFDGQYLIRKVLP